MAEPTDEHEARRIVMLDYTNHRGERTMRRVLPIRLLFASTEWHPEPQWLLHGRDLDRGEDRYFTLCDVHSWWKGGP